jgi:ribosomal protein S18 acetylase RimI-like enzyme
MHHHRPYDDAHGDFQRLWDFITHDHPDRSGHIRWTHGRLSDWKYNLVTDRKWVPTFLSQGAHLWLDPFGHLLGAALNENMAATVTLLTRVHHDYLFEEMLHWAQEAWAGFARPLETEPASGHLFTVLDAFHPEEGATLAAHGWEDLGPTEITRRYDVAAKAAEPLLLPAGFRLVSLQEDPNFASKQRLYHSAWHQDKPVTDLNLRIYEYCRMAPIYDPTLDFSVVAPSGEHVAGCVAFVDDANSYAEIEKVCTHSAHRRQGLAEAVLRHCFQALHRRGIRQAYITGENDAAVSLYGKLGAVEEWPQHTWRRVVARPA